MSPSGDFDYDYRFECEYQASKYTMSERLKPFANKDKPSKVEQAKAASKHLRSTIADVLGSEATGFDHDDQQVMKFHGIYQQEDRDIKSVKRVTGVDPTTSFMIRIKVPGGVLTPEQYLGMDKLADEVTYNASLRITTRQNFQLHGVLKGQLKSTMQHINDVLLDTLCGCGDVERNIMAPPAPLPDKAHQEIRQLTRELSDALCPRTRAYHEVWLNGEKVDTSVEESEELYGDTYLPRKFKTGIGLPEDNSVDVHSQDVGLIGVIENDQLVGCNMLVGGGLGMTHKKPETYARLGTPLGYVERENIVEACRTMVTIHRDFGDRTDRKHARLKYIIEEQGIDAVRAEFEERASFKLKPWVELGELKHEDSLGAHVQNEAAGRWFYGLYVPNGRVMDYERARYKSAIKAIVEGFQPEVILTPNQNILFGGLDEKQVKSIDRVLEAFNVPRVEDLTAVTRYGMSCVALPTCSLALTEAERIFPKVLSDIQREFEAVALEDEPVTIRMTGCPNGCARPYTADIGLVGHKPGHYDLFLGGSLHGHRMAEFYALNVPIDDVGSTLRPILEHWAKHRNPDEPLGEYYNRVFANDADRHIVTGDRENPARQRVEAMLA